MATFTMETLSTLPTLQVAGYIYSFVNLQGPESRTSQIDANLIRDTIMASVMTEFNVSGSFGGIINSLPTVSEISAEVSMKEIKGNITYNPQTRSFYAEFWLDIAGELQVSPTSCDLDVYGSSGSVYSPALNSSPNSFGVFTFTQTLDLAEFDTYRAEISIVSSGTTYKNVIPLGHIDILENVPRNTRKK